MFVNPSHKVLAGATALAFVLAAPVYPQEEEVEPEVVTFGLELLGEYDDNPNLGADNGDPFEEAKEDFVLRAIPSFGIDYPYEDHRLKLDVGGIFREGIDTPLSEFNLRARGGANLVFPSGLEIDLFDFYLRTRFDQALFFVDSPDLALAEPGVSETEGNSIGVNFRYVPKRRFTVDGRVSTTDRHFVFGTPNAPPDDRATDIFAATVELPLTLRWVGYLAADGNDQASVRQAPRNFDERRYVAGIRWERSERVALFVEAGSGAADFDDTPGVEFDETVWVVGSEIDFSDDTRLEVAFGKDLYDQMIYEVLVDRTRGTDSGLRLLIRKSSQNSFAPDTLGRFFEATVVGLKWRRSLRERLFFEAEARYFQLDATQGAELQEDETTLGRVKFEYAIGPRWLRLGAYAQVSERDSTTPGSRFENSRIGLTLKLARGTP